MTRPRPAIMGSLIMSLETEESSVTRPLPRPLLGSSWSHHYIEVTMECYCHWCLLTLYRSPHILIISCS